MDRSGRIIFVYTRRIMERFCQKFTTSSSSFIIFYSKIFSIKFILHTFNNFKFSLIPSQIILQCRYLIGEKKKEKNCISDEIISSSFQQFTTVDRLLTIGVNARYDGFRIFKNLGLPASGGALRLLSAA